MWMLDPGGISDASAPGGPLWGGRGAESGLVVGTCAEERGQPREAGAASVPMVINGEHRGLGSQPTGRAWEPFVMQIPLPVCLPPWDFFVFFSRYIWLTPWLGSKKIKKERKKKVI